MKKIRKGDMVVVIAGQDKGRRGSVKQIMGDRVVVSGVNIRKKHVKPNPQLGIQGGRIDLECPVSISNIALFSESANSRVKVGFRNENGNKIRFVKLTGEMI